MVDSDPELALRTSMAEHAVELKRLSDSYRRLTGRPTFASVDSALDDLLRFCNGVAQARGSRASQGGRLPDDVAMIDEAGQVVAEVVAPKARSTDGWSL